MMQKAKDIASQPMTVDEAKVARLQKLIDEGKYKVDSQSIADRLVDEHLAIPD
jgi:flagellar biosynthesis anti-sigma factor FlgM